MKKVFAEFMIFSAACFFASAEDFRVAKIHEISIPQNYAPQTVQSGIFDGIAISLPDDKTFISGIEISIKIPEIIATWRDTVAYSFYKNIAPDANKNRIDYSGNRISFNTLPGRLTHTVYVPLNKKFTIKNTPYATVLEQNYSDEGTLFLRFTLAMKGAPEALEQAVLNVTVKPVLSDEGLLDVDFEYPGENAETFSAYIDDIPAGDFSKPRLLKTGQHHLSITSSAYRNEMRTFIIEQAAKTNITVKFKGIEPTVRILSPENAKIIFDGTELSDKDEFTVESGAHSVSFIIGDYEIKKTFNAVNGRSYTVNLNIDATVTEE